MMESEVTITGYGNFSNFDDNMNIDTKVLKNLLIRLITEVESKGNRISKVILGNLNHQRTRNII